MAARDIRALPKLEGTVHVNIALIVKFLANYLFRPAPYPRGRRVSEPRHDAFLFDQGPASGLGEDPLPRPRARPSRASPACPTSPSSASRSRP